MTRKNEQEAPDIEAQKRRRAKEAYGRSVAGAIDEARANGEESFVAIWFKSIRTNPLLPEDVLDGMRLVSAGLGAAADGLEASPWQRFEGEGDGNPTKLRRALYSVGGEDYWVIEARDFEIVGEGPMSHERDLNFSISLERLQAETKEAISETA